MTASGIIRLSGYELAAHFEDDLIVIRKYEGAPVFTVVYYDGGQKYHYIKRFQAEASEKEGRFYDEHPKSKFVMLSENDFPRLEIRFGGKFKKRTPEVIEVDDFIAVKGIKAKGKRLSNLEIASVAELEPLRFKHTKEPLPEPPPEESDPGSDKPDVHDGGDKGEQMSLF